MKEETAQESRFTSIFKDTWGRWSSDNSAFLSWTLVLQLGFLIITVTSCIVAFIDPEHAPGIVASLYGGCGVFATPIWALNTHQKRKYTKSQMEKGTKENV